MLSNKMYYKRSSQDGKYFVYEIQKDGSYSKSIKDEDFIIKNNEIEASKKVKWKTRINISDDLDFREVYPPALELEKPYLIGYEVDLVDIPKTFAIINGVFAYAVIYNEQISVIEVKEPVADIVKDREKYKLVESPRNNLLPFVKLKELPTVVKNDYNTIKVMHGENLANAIAGRTLSSPFCLVDFIDPFIKGTYNKFFELKNVPKNLYWLGWNYNHHHSFSKTIDGILEDEFIYNFMKKYENYNFFHVYALAHSYLRLKNAIISNADTKIEDVTSMLEVLCEKDSPYGGGYAIKALKDFDLSIWFESNLNKHLTKKLNNPYMSVYRKALIECSDILTHLLNITTRSGTEVFNLYISYAEYLVEYMNFNFEYTVYLLGSLKPEDKKFLVNYSRKDYENLTHKKVTETYQGYKVNMSRKAFNLKYR